MKMIATIDIVEEKNLSISLFLNKKIFTFESKDLNHAFEKCKTLIKENTKNE